MQNLLDPAILFFIFGVLAGSVRSSLEVPPAIAKFLSLYLLMALGLKGGFALAQSGLRLEILLSLGVAVSMAFLVPALGYAFLRGKVSRFDAAAVAASYGSVSAVTFVTASQSLENAGIAVGGHMAVAMVLMETPAILMAIIFANALRRNAQGGASSGPSARTSVGSILHESFTDGAQMLLLGSLAIGVLSGEAGRTVMEPFSGDLFKGLLSFFLLDMGLMVARNFRDARQASGVLVGYALLAPWLHACLALGLAWALSLPLSDTVLLMVLSASASYIVVPAVLREAVPEANPAIYFGLSLGVTFPMNILVGIPAYTALARVVMT